MKPYVSRKSTCSAVSCSSSSKSGMEMTRLARGSAGSDEETARGEEEREGSATCMGPPEGRNRPRIPARVQPAQKTPVLSRAITKNARACVWTDRVVPGGKARRDRRGTALPHPAGETMFTNDGFALLIGVDDYSTYDAS